MDAPVSLRDTCTFLTTRCASAVFILLLLPGSAPAQELEPGAYWPIPTGLNIVTVVNSFNAGDLAFDPSAPIDEASATINTTAFAFTRAFNLAGRSANAAVVLPVVGGHLEGLLLGEPAETGRFGLGDPRLKFAVNLYGAPAMTPKEFASYSQGRILGVSLVVAPPLGQYDLGKVDQHRHPSLVLQAGDRCVDHAWPLGCGSHGGRLVVYGQHGLLSEDGRGSRTRLSRPRFT